MEPGLSLLLDSTEMIDALRNRSEGRNRINEALRVANGVYTSAMNVAEIYGGMRPGEETQIQKLLDSVRILPVTFAVAKRAGELRSTRALLGRTHSIQDMIVAATALENGLTLVTQNRKDFPIEGLTFWP